MTDFLKGYLYIVTDVNDNYRHLSYHKTQRSAYYEVATLSDIPLTKRNFNEIGSSGGWLSEKGNFFVLEVDLLDTRYDLN